MNEDVNFRRIAKAIAYICDNFKDQPSLEEIAAYVNLSPSHFLRMFQDYVGVTPKKFLQYLDVNHAKQILQNRRTSVFDAAYQTGLSGTGRLHDLFVNIEGMTPGDYKNGGENLQINYSLYDTLFGKIFVASTLKGICYMGFDDSEQYSLNELRRLFPNAHYTPQQDENQHCAVRIFHQNWKNREAIKLHLKGTDFQLKVWETLLRIPVGDLVSYGDVANELNHPKASRAVGSAVGANPVGVLIPCHRVIQSSGILGQYHWGAERKAVLVAWEGAITPNP